ncbi:MAG: hypothetical protein HKO53_13795 [Gemmatimonadetes bacterium]|nr:hypothetical protein [Gemmatimonadota bacterium]
MDKPSVAGPPPPGFGAHTPEVHEPRPLGLAFLLGVVVGSTATLLLTSEDDKADRRVARPRRVLRRRKAEPTSFGDVVRREAIHVAESVLRDVGHVASRWVLESLAAQPAGTEEEDDTPSGPGPRDTE